METILNSFPYYYYQTFSQQFVYNQPVSSYFYDSNNIYYQNNGSVQYLDPNASFIQNQIISFQNDQLSNQLIQYSTESVKDKHVVKENDESKMVKNEDLRSRKEKYLVDFKNKENHFRREGSDKLSRNSKKQGDNHLQKGITNDQTVSDIKVLASSNLNDESKQKDLGSKIGSLAKKDRNIEELKEKSISKIKIFAKINSTDQAKQKYSNSRDDSLVISEKVNAKMKNKFVTKIKSPTKLNTDNHIKQSDLEINAKIENKTRQDSINVDNKATLVQHVNTDFSNNFVKKSNQMILDEDKRKNSKKSERKYVEDLKNNVKMEMPKNIEDFLIQSDIMKAQDRENEVKNVVNDPFYERLLNSSRKQSDMYDKIRNAYLINSQNNHFDKSLKNESFSNTKDIIFGKKYEALNDIQKELSFKNTNNIPIKKFDGVPTKEGTKFLNKNENFAEEKSEKDFFENYYGNISFLLNKKKANFL